MRKYIHIVLVLILAGACTAGNGDEATGDTTDGGSTPESAGPSATFPANPRADGVTADSIRLGVTYVDLEALADVIDIDHGDYEAAYQALADDINADGGINGRQLDLVFQPIVPVGTTEADAACVRLTEDEGVFAVVGFMLDDAPLCYSGVHDTPVIGGTITQERLDRGEAPWFSNEASPENITDRLVEAFAADGAFDGATTGVIALAADQDLMEDVVVPTLEASDIEVADTAAVDVPDDDQAAGLAQVGVIAERFRAAGIDTVLTVGNATVITAQGLGATGFRPRLLATNAASLLGYLSSADGFDAEVVQDALTGGYAPYEVQAEDPAIQECVSVVEAASDVELPHPADVQPGEPETYVATYVACQQLSLFRQIADAAGEDLNNGTFGNAGYTLGEIDLPGDGGTAVYGPDSLDGERPIYLSRFDEAEGRLVNDPEATD